MPKQHTQVLLKICAKKLFYVHKPLFKLHYKSIIYFFLGKNIFVPSTALSSNWQESKYNMLTISNKNILFQSKQCIIFLFKEKRKWNKCINNVFAA